MKLSELRPKPYENGSWELLDFATSPEGREFYKDEEGCYLPTPTEIEKRIEIMDTLKGLKFSGFLIRSILNEMPCYAKVERMLTQYGLRGTKARLRKFLR